MSPTDPTRRRVAVILGTRPEAVKLAPVVRELAASPGLEPVVVSTGQHRQMLDQMLPQLGVSVDVELDVMRDRQSLHGLTSRLAERLGEALAGLRVDAAVVQGDTTTAFVGALAAFYEKLPVAHVEAGLRSGVATDPFPEELNRQLVGRIARWHFAPTLAAGVNLLREGVRTEDVDVTGNTVIDNLLWVLGRGLGVSAFPTGAAGRKVLVTLHRRENQGPGMVRLASAIRSVADDRDVHLLLPLHKSPAVREVLVPLLGGHPRITLTEPLDYLDFTATLASSDLVLTDSGGVQEEAPTLGKPVLVLRETTERPEAVHVGAARLVGTDERAVREAALELLDDAAVYDAMAGAGNPFGDGHAAEKIVARLARDLGVAPAVLDLTRPVTDLLAQAAALPAAEPYRVAS